MPDTDKKYLLDVFSSNEDYSACSYAIVEIDDDLRTFIKSVQKDVIPKMTDRPFLVIEFFDHTPTYFDRIPEEIESHDVLSGEPNTMPLDSKTPESDVRVGVSVIQVFDNEVCWRMIAKHCAVSHTTVPIRNEDLFDPGFEDRVLESLGM